MQNYNRTVWKDHIKDQYGNVIQQGTPVSAQHLNNIENQVVALSAKENVLAELVKETIPSGFTTLSDLNYTYMATNPNQIKLLSDSVAYVNGYKITIPAGTIVTLDAPPTTGTREDLVFLEVYKVANTNGAEQLGFTLRVVDGIDFVTYPEGLNNTSVAKARGANATDTTYTFTKSSTDVGMYTSGSGSSTDKTVLGTVDGYVYAIPMFKIHRRNSGDYSAINGNGASTWSTGITSTRPDKLFSNIIADRDIIDLRHKVSLTGFNYQSLLEENFDKLLRGELQTKDKTKMLKTYHGIAKTPIDSNTVFYASLDGTTNFEVNNIGARIVTNKSIFYPSPTGLSNNSKIVVDSITLDSNSKYTSECFVDGSKPARGDGISLIAFYDVTNSKTIAGLAEVNSSTISITLDGTPVLSFPRPSKFFHARLVVSQNMVYCYIDGTLKNSKSLSKTPITISFTANGYSNSLANTDVSNSGLCDLAISNIDRGANFATLPQDVIDGYARISNAFNGQRQVFSDALTSQYTLEKITASASGRGKQFADTTQATAGQWATGDTIKVKGLGGEIISGVIDSDTALAKVVTASTTTTIYVDDVSKFAVSDTVVLNGTGSIYTISAIDTTNKTLTVNTSVTTNIGDLLYETTASSSSPTMKVSITGTAQAGATSTITLPTTFNAADDAYNNLDIMITSGTGAGQRKTIGDYVGSTKVATVSSAWTTTPDSTSQFIIYNVSVAGTWSGLGTNESTFTLGTLYALNTQDIQVEYSLNQIAGQGGISEVLTTTLAGECNGKKLIVNPSVHIRDDFNGKVSGDLTACPNSAYTASESSLQVPTGTWSEFAQGDYTNVLTLDGTCKSVSTTANGQQAQILIKKNIVRIVEDKFGTIPALDKVKWCKDNIASITLNAYTYGSCPSGNKVYLDGYDVSADEWYWLQEKGTPTARMNTASSPSVLSFSMLPTICIDNNCMVSFSLYTDASDGVTPSTLSLDYAYIDVVMKTPVGYDVLAPENPRRDDGKANMLLVRKETKEIQVFMDACNTDGIVSYGDMIPDQSIAKQNGVVLATSDNLYLITGGTGGVSTGNYKNSSSRIGMSSANSNLTGTIINLESADTVTKAPIINEKLINKTTTDGTSLIGKNIANNTSKVVTGIDLVKVNGEIYLKTRSKYDNSINVNNSTATTVDFKVENRILIK